jgi:septal ring factor EnvC (AmiA/AmiB activator)
MKSDGIQLETVRTREPLYIKSYLMLFVMIALPISSQWQSLYASRKSDSEITKKQIEKIETDLSREKEKLLKFGEKEKSLLGQLSHLERKIDETKRLLKRLQERIGLSKKELSRHRTRLTQLEHSFNRIEERLSKRLVAFYKYAKRGYMQLLATSSGLDQLRKRVKYLKVIMDEDRQLFKKMVATQLKHKGAMAQIEEKITVINSLENDEKGRMASLKEDLEKKVILLMKIHKEKEFYETAVKELQLAAKDLKNTLLNLEKKPGKKKQLPSGFANAKGELPPPVKGKILKNTGPLGTSLQLTHKGVYIGGPAGSEVKAVFPGRVDYSGWLKGYGQIIVINHGSRFFTVSAHLSQRNKQKGDMVQKGESIGLLGETGSLTGPMLYFEIRKGGSHLDPNKWLKVN